MKRAKKQKGALLCSFFAGILLSAKAHGNQNPRLRHRSLKSTVVTAQTVQIPAEFEWVRLWGYRKTKKHHVRGAFLFLVTRTGIEPMISA